MTRMSSRQDEHSHHSDCMNTVCSSDQEWCKGCNTKKGQRPAFMAENNRTSALSHIQVS